MAVLYILLFSFSYSAIFADEIGGKGVKLDHDRKLFIKTVSRTEATTDYLGDYILYSLLSDPLLECGDYSFIDLASINVEKVSVPKKWGFGTKTKFKYSRQLFPLGSIEEYRWLYQVSGPIEGYRDWRLVLGDQKEEIRLTKQNIHQFALTALVDQIVLNTDRFAAGEGGKFNERNLMWYRKSGDEFTLLPIDNGWGAGILIMQYNLLRRHTHADDIRLHIIKQLDIIHQRVERIAGNDKETLEQFWNLNKEFFQMFDKSFLTGYKREVSSDKKIQKLIAAYWKKHRVYVAQQIDSMMHEQLENKIEPLFAGDCDEKPKCKSQKETVEWMKQAIEKNLEALKPKTASARRNGIWERLESPSMLDRENTLLRLRGMLNQLEELEVYDGQ